MGGCCPIALISSTMFCQSCRGTDQVLWSCFSCLWTSLRVRTIDVLSDNTRIVYCINRQDSSRSLSIIMTSRPSEGPGASLDGESRGRENLWMDTMSSGNTGRRPSTESCFWCPGSEAQGILLHPALGQGRQSTPDYVINFGQ